MKPDWAGPVKSLSEASQDLSLKLTWVQKLFRVELLLQIDLGRIRGIKTSLTKSNKVQYVSWLRLSFPPDVGE